MVIVIYKKYNYNLIDTEIEYTMHKVYNNRIKFLFA